jgi:3-oxoacyl-[acyl-carrier-protein] synthase-3
MGSYVPETVLTNFDLEKLVDTSDEWIYTRTGIKERRIESPDRYTSHMCISAIENMLARYSVTLEDVDLVLVATHTPDYACPSTACLIQKHFGFQQAGAIDLNATCAGFVYGLHLANGMISSGLHRKILVVGADTLSKTTDYTDRTTCILFGDGAGCVLLERTEESSGFIAYHGGSDGSGAKHLYRTGLSAMLDGEPLKANGHIVQNGQEVFRFAVSAVPEGIEALLRKSSMSAGDIDWFIPHNANLRIIKSICERTSLPLERTLHMIEHYGNTSAATIPLAWDAAVQGSRLQDGDTLLLYGFGGGYVHGGLLWRWSDL